MSYLNPFSRWLLELLALLGAIVISVLALSGVAGWFDLSFTQAAKIAASTIIVFGVWIEPWAGRSVARAARRRR